MKKFCLKKGSVKYTRLIILGLILGGAMFIHYQHIFPKETLYPSVHSICPLGGLENLWAWINGHRNLQRIFSGTMTLFFFTVGFAFVFGRAFCGNICPLGALQEFFGKITKKRIVVPEKVDNILRFTKYIVLVFITIMAWITARLWIRYFDPWAAFAHLFSDELLKEFLVGFIILLITLIASVFIDRFFCKYFCPTGALLGIIAKIAPSKIKRNIDCNSCGLCSKSCPMNIKVNALETVKSTECIKCGQCVVACPTKNNDLRMTIFGKTIKPLAFVLITVLIFFGGLFAFQQAGMLQVGPPSLEWVLRTGNFIRVNQLRGAMRIEQGAQYVGMELSSFYTLMEIPTTVPQETRLRDVGQFVPGWYFEAIRDSR